jgi:hypothetical protein
MGVIRFFVGWVLRVAGILVIAAAWLGYFGLWKNIGSFSLNFITKNLAVPIGLTIAGIFLIAFSSAIARLGE